MRLIEQIKQYAAADPEGSYYQAGYAGQLERRGGDLIDFVVELQSLEFAEAVDRTAEGLRKLLDRANPVTGPRKTIWTADELLAAEFPPLKWAVPGLLPEGLTVLGGRPKVGKSMLALQIAYSVATGGKCLGRDVGQGKVLLICLEDSGRRLKDRMSQQQWPSGTQVTIVLERFRPAALCWQLDGAAGLGLSELQDKVMAALMDAGGKSWGRAIAQAIDRAPGSVCKELKELAHKGVVK